MSNQATALLLSLCALFMFLVGCGGDGESTDGEATVSADSRASRVIIPWGPEDVTKPEYIRRANGVCEESWDRTLDSHRTRYDSATKGKAFDEVAQNVYLPGMQFWFDDIAYLDAPEGEKDEVEAMLTVLQLAVWNGQDGAVLSPAQFTRIFSDFSRMAEDYGLDSCIVKAGSFEG